MDLRKLRHAVALAEEGTFARAARRLNLTQPALTRSVQALEASLGLTLFDRTTAGVHPTVNGRRVLDHARTLLRQEASLRSEAEQLARGESGRVAFGIGPMLTPVLGPALAEVVGGGARLDIRVEVQPIHVLAELLLDDRIDFFVAAIRSEAALAELQVTPLRTVPAGYFVRAGHPLARGAPLSLADLAPWPLASTDLGEELPYLSPAQTIACEDCQVLKQVALASDAVIIAMALSVQPELGAGGIVHLQGEGLFTEAAVGLVQRISRTLSAGAQRVIRALDAGIERSQSA